MEGLTEKQAAFVEAYVSGGLHQTEAAAAAGYANARVDAWRCLQSPSVMAAVQRARAALIAGEGAKLAWATVEGLMRDALTPAAVRFSAARWTLEAAGLGLAAQVAKAQGETEKDLAGMTLGELEAFIARGREALGALKSVHPSTVIDALPVEAGSGEFSAG